MSDEHLTFPPEDQILVSREQYHACWRLLHQLYYAQARLNYESPVSKAYYALNKMLTTVRFPEERRFMARVVTEVGACTKCEKEAAEKFARALLPEDDSCDLPVSDRCFQERMSDILRNLGNLLPTAWLGPRATRILIDTCKRKFSRNVIRRMEANYKARIKEAAARASKKAIKKKKADETVGELAKSPCFDSEGCFSGPSKN